VTSNATSPGHIIYGSVSISSFGLHAVVVGPNCQIVVSTGMQSEAWISFTGTPSWAQPMVKPAAPVGVQVFGWIG
jgi:hypothetical protein